MQPLNEKLKTLAVAGLISGLLAIAIAGLSPARQQQSALADFDRPTIACASTLCSLL